MLKRAHFFCANRGSQAYQQLRERHNASDAIACPMDVRTVWRGRGIRGQGFVNRSSPIYLYLGPLHLTAPFYPDLVLANAT